ncbi:YfhE family protein [Sporosarcina sp. BI001-red]|nr:YfhE family protein [Sporosarcina sp. BI001-red]REB10118.1 YfhE family protein [Sporosarcina sp. BI001-red]
MTEKKEPHEMLTEKNNGLSSAQEVEYANDFKKADNSTKNKNKRKKEY